MDFVYDNFTPAGLTVIAFLTGILIVVLMVK